MSFKSKCELCNDETKGMVYECGPDTFWKTKARICCRNYECNAFSEAHLYPDDVMPERSTKSDEKTGEADAIPDFRFTEADKVPLFDDEGNAIAPKPEGVKKKTAAKKTTRKKAEKK